MLYKYQAIDTDDRPRDGVLNADSPERARVKLETRCLRVLLVVPVGDIRSRSPENISRTALNTGWPPPQGGVATPGHPGRTPPLGIEPVSAGDLLHDGPAARAGRLLKYVASGATGFMRSRATRVTVGSWSSRAARATTADELKSTRGSSARQTVTKPESKRGHVSDESLDELKRSVNRLMPWQRRVPHASVAVLMRQCSLMLRSGLSLVDALKFLAAGEHNPVLRLALLEVRRDVESGSTVAVAFSRQAPLHSPTLQCLLEVTERSGELARSFDMYAVNLERTAELVQNLKSALTYPTLVVGAAMVMVGAFFRFMFPPFVGLLSSLQSDLPWPTKLLFGIHRLISNPLVVAAFLLIAACLGWLARQHLRTAGGRDFQDRLLLKLPLAGKLIERVALSNFLSTLGLLLSTGNPVVRAMNYASGVCGNSVIVQQIEGLTERVKAGLTLSEVLVGSPLFAGDIGAMVSAGELSSELCAMLEKVCDMINEDVRMKLESATHLLEPLLMGLLGLILGFIFLALFLPIYQVIGTIGG